MSSLQFTLSREPPSSDERAALDDHLRDMGADEAVWDVFGCFLATRSATTRPLALRASRDGRLAGIAFMVECTAYGRSLFDGPWLAWALDHSGIPALTWLRSGLCAETFANPGFVANGFDRGATIAAMISWLRRHRPVLFVNDSTANRPLHARAREFPYVRDGAVDIAGMSSVSDYIAQHNNIRRKIKGFANKGGTIDLIEGPLGDGDMAGVAHCVASTVDNSIIASPFQDLFPEMVAATCAHPSPRFVHLVAHLDGQMLGYHSFVRTGRGLRMLHGAFDRTLKSTLHAYENLIIRAVAHGIERRLDRVHFGPILNETKRRMMNATEPAALFFSSNNPLLGTAIPAFFPLTKMQSRELLAFR
ncbi:MAG: GNAT family N-acetyltransferase [Verrucomicrobiae bacterium]|nr:GNAT family N-acetyltransferase [Verrucomicrobiae bacterium]